MKVFASIACFLIVLAAASCSGQPAPDVAPPDPASSQQDAGATSDSLPAREQFVEQGLRSYGTTRASFAGALGEPDSVEAEVIPNRHIPGAVDTLFTVYYPGLVAHIHRPGPGGELLSSVEVAENRYLRYSVIGATRSAVVNAFGTPDESSTGSVTYHCTRCVAGENPVVLSFEDGRVRAVTFNYYVD